jgi:hypothetical protein
MYLCLALATAGTDAPGDGADPAPDLDEALRPALDQVRRLVEQFRAAPVTPTAALRLENDLQQQVRALGRLAVAWAYNHLEPAPAAALPRQVGCEADPFRRLARKTPQEVSTLFGPVVVRRWGYRAAPAVGAPVLFPLGRALGLVHGATPAAAERAARYLAEAGATQQQALARLRHEHGLRWGVKRLRQAAAAVAAALEEHRPGAQAGQVLRWLAQAQASPGPHRPVLGVGRDGITLGLRVKGGAIHEVASTATVTVYDRRSRRLGTVYLARVPEPGQGALAAQLTQLLTEVLRRWPGPVPRLCYVTDAGDNETAYYRKVLRRLRHPGTGRRLGWFWVVDYYHAAERLGAMAEALFGAGRRAWAWVRKMQKLLLKPGGLYRVLHSAAALRSRGQLRGKRLADFRRAYNYLRDRGPHLRYADYRRLGLPIGSGVTEAACKTVFAQRLKLSGMRWHKAGAQTILTLRVILLSGIWQEVYEHAFQAPSEVEVRTPGQLHGPEAENAA